MKGLKDQAVQAAKELLEIQDALEVINSQIIPALDVVGKGFEKGTMFLPQLLMSAEAAKAAFAVVKESMEASGEVQEKKGLSRKSWMPVVRSRRRKVRSFWLLLRVIFTTSERIL